MPTTKLFISSWLKINVKRPETIFNINYYNTEFILDPSGEYYFDVRDNAATESGSPVPSIVVDLEKWYHFAYIIKDDKVAIYLDGLKFYEGKNVNMYEGEITTVVSEFGNRNDISTYMNICEFFVSELSNDDYKTFPAAIDVPTKALF